MSRICLFFTRQDSISLEVSGIRGVGEGFQGKGVGEAGGCRARQGRMLG